MGLLATMLTDELEKAVQNGYSMCAVNDHLVGTVYEVHLLTQSNRVLIIKDGQTIGEGDLPENPEYNDYLEIINILLTKGGYKK